MRPQWQSSLSGNGSVRPAPSGHEGHRSESAPTKGPVPGRPPGPGPSTTSARSTEEEP